MKRVALFLKEVFSNRKYSLVFSASALLVLLVSIWLPNLKFILGFLFSFENSLLEKAKFFFNSLNFFFSNFSSLSQATTIIIALLVGFNVVLMMKLFHKSRKVNKVCYSGTGAGFVAGFFGIGCASCGSFLLASIFGVGTSLGILSQLPLSGQEFSLISIGILAFSIKSLYGKVK